MEDIFRLEDLLLYKDSHEFRLNNCGNASGNLRLHASGLKDTATVEEARARFAIRVTKNQQWLNQAEISAVEAGEVDGCVFSKAFSHQLKAFAHADGSNWGCVCYMMSCLGEVCDMSSAVVEMWAYSIHHFCFIAALMAEGIGCRTMTVVVEISV